MEDDDRPTTTLRFEGGPRDGLVIRWSGDETALPHGFAFVDHHYDRTIERGMAPADALRAALEAKHLGTRSHVYTNEGVESDRDGEPESWVYKHVDSRTVLGPEHGA